MRVLFFVFFVAFFLATQIVAQTKELTLSDAILKRRTELSPQTIKKLSWTINENQYLFEEDKEGVSTYFIGDVLTKEQKKLISLSDFNTILNLSEDKRLTQLPVITWINANDFSFEYNHAVYLYDIAKKKAAKAFEFNEKASNKSFAKKTLKIAYTVADNLFISDASGEYAITNDGGNGIVNGQAVHRFEFGIFDGIFWSPHENYLAFYRKDETMVADYPLVDISTKPATLNNIKYPMAGEASHHVTIGIYNVKNKKTIFLKTGNPKEQYLTNISWSPDEKYVYVAVLNRDQNHLKLNRYDAVSGELIATIFEEKDAQYVQPLHPMFWLKDNKHFVWNSQREGFKQLYLYTENGELIRKLTETNWDVLNILKENEQDNEILFYGTGENGSEKHLFSVKIETGKIENLTKIAGTHRVNVNSNGKYSIDRYTSIGKAGETRIINNNGKVIATLLQPKSPLSDYKIGENELFTIKAADNKTDLYCRMIKPFDFDKTKKYPVLVYVYNGPGVQLITNSYVGGASLWMYEFANRGYIVFTVDGRGSSNRGEEFEQATFRNLGTVEIEDQLKGVEYLTSLPYIDTTKMAVHGWSYGGFMTTSLMLKSPNTFKVGVAGGPVIDWKYYEIMYTERYMDTPQANVEGYKAASLLNYVTNLQGKLLLIHGTVDDVVVWQHSLDFVKTCVDNEVQVDYFVYPQHPHNVRGKDRVHLMTKVLNYIELELNR